MVDTQRDLSSKKRFVREMAETDAELVHVSDGKVGQLQEIQYC